MNTQRECREISYWENQADEISGKICFVTKEMQTVAKLEKTHSPLGFSSAT